MEVVINFPLFRQFQRFALPALGRAAERRQTGKMIRRRKKLGIAPESPASGARFVRRFFYYTRLFAQNRQYNQSNKVFQVT